MITSQKNLLNLLKNLPEGPGVYQMKRKEGEILYVGKAKNLKKRVRSYFQKKAGISPRHLKLLENTSELDYIEVGSELEALILETNLIKKFRPRYNIMMRDDKNFIYLKITNEDFPRVMTVRKICSDGAYYFGPKTSDTKAQKMVRVLKRVFPFRTCALGIKEISEGKVQLKNRGIKVPCLDYHLKRCLGPCIEACTVQEYKKIIQQVIYFLEGKSRVITDELRKQIQELAVNKKFEQAVKFRDRLFAVEEIMEKQRINVPEPVNQDVLNFVFSQGKFYFNLFMVREGKLADQENFILSTCQFKKEEVKNSEVLEAFLKQYYEKAASFPEEILIPEKIENKELLEKWLKSLRGQRVKILFPERGRKNQLLKLSVQNAESFARQSQGYFEKALFEEGKKEKPLAKILGLKKIPRRIEGYDISHLGGTETVGSMVVFEKGLPKRKDYRHFKLKSLKGGEIDDGKALLEVLRRRLKYLSYFNLPGNLKFRKVRKAEIPLMRKKIKEENLDSSRLSLSNNFILGKGKKIIGFGRIKNYEGKVYEIASLWIEPKLRSKGLGTILLFALLPKCKARRIYAACHQKYRSFYENVGFREIFKVPKVWAKKKKICRRVDPINKPVFFVYDRAKLEDPSFKAKPDLIVVDGGKGQLEAALKAIKEIGLSLPVIALAKKEETIFVAGRKPLVLERNSSVLQLFQRLRDEAHRFALEYQKKLRSKKMFNKV